MSVIEIKVTKYRTTDGKQFDDKEEAEEYDRIYRIDALLTESDTDSLSKGLVSPALYRFLTKNRDEIIDIMRWENEE